MRALPIVLFLSMVVACDGSDEAAVTTTDGLATAEIGLSIQLRSNGGIAQLFVTPTQGGAALVLGGGDRLVGGPEDGAEEPLLAIEPAAPDAMETRHAAQFETAATRFVVGLIRGSGERVDSTCDLPAPFTPAAPDGPVSRAEPIEITWDAPAETIPMAVAIEGECIHPVYRQLQTDAGMFTIQPPDLFVAAGTQGCTLDVELTRTGSSASFAAELGPSPPPVTEQIRNASIETVP